MIGGMRDEPGAVRRSATRVRAGRRPATPPGGKLEAWAGEAMAAAGRIPARHHRLLLARLQAVADGACDRLLVLMPPGAAKSTYSSVLFPAWFLGMAPEAQIVAACHTEALALHFGRRVRATVAEAAALGTLPCDLARDDRAAGRFATTLGGSYYATGVRGPITGRRADLAIVDDPVKSHAEAESRTVRDATWDWFRSELLTRLTPQGRAVVVMTRWHRDDLAGRILDGPEPWTCLRLPALAEADDPLGRAPGAPLWPEWENAAALERKRRAVGPRTWAALYQQAPQTDAEALFRADRIPVLDAAPPAVRAVRAWDLAATSATEGRDPDWTVGLKLGRTEAGLFVVLDVVRLRAGPGVVATTIVDTARSDGKAVAIGLPQDPGQAGKQQVAFLGGMLAGWRVTASPETGSKLVRAGPAAALAEAGTLAVVRASWTDALLDELRGFPGGAKDDQVDALSRAVAMLTTKPPTAVDLSLMSR